jgi:hypothetical protein
VKLFVPLLFGSVARHAPLLPHAMFFAEASTPENVEVADKQVHSRKPTFQSNLSILSGTVPARSRAGT